ncbi:TonB-dependent siderophore receptor [Aquabacterium fontiphilum]|uniref:TonB-dependent siderophore receptor n=1 Tax=Aquabacterium fontiphilum TaxID=450365 RepID=UPI0013777A12|nr:TonB-dependent siderophore receptor [Aquabacterium fontiphilum]NBD21253.1 TonB-dependent siderophore receptor [Aquabacterium fontiphilum]
MSATFPRPARRRAVCRVRRAGLSVLLGVGMMSPGWGQGTTLSGGEPVPPAAVAVQGATVDAEDAGALPTVTVTAAPAAGAPSPSAFSRRRSASATRLDLTLRETPQSISVVSRAQMDAFGLRDARAVLDTVPGVNVERVETDRTYYSVRGFEVSNFQLDGVGLPFATGDQTGDIDTAVYDRVDVLRGANGLLSSTGNPSATVNFVRKRPTADTRFAGGLTLGSWDQVRLDADWSGALTADRAVRGRFVAAAEDKASYLDRYESSKRVAAATVEVDLSASTLLTAGYALQRNRPSGVGWGALPLIYTNGEPTRYPRSANVGPAWSYWHTDDAQAFADVLHDLGGGWTVKGTVQQRKIGGRARLFYVYGDLDQPTGAGLRSYPSVYRNDEQQWLGDVHAKGPFSLAGRRHEAVVGLSVSRSKSDMASRYDDVGVPVSEDDVLAGRFPLPDFDQPESGFGRFKDWRRTAYGVARFNVHDHLKLIGGLNVTRVSSAGEQYGEPHHYRTTRAQPFAGVVADITPHASVYASVADIFNPQTKTDQQSRLLDPIQGRTVEAGIKAESPDRKLTGSLAVFRVAQDNTAESAGFEDGRTYYRGVDATSKGFEAEVAGQPMAGWRLSAGFTWLRIEGEDGESVRTYVPRRTLRVSSLADVPGVTGLAWGGVLKWQSDISRELSDGVVRQKAYALLDAVLRYQVDKSLAVTAQVHNVTHTRYLNSLLWEQAYVGAPRSVSLNLAWSL